MAEDACGSSPLYRLFNPRGVAIVGASAAKTKIGYKVLLNIVNGGYEGGIYPVNPSGGEILGKKVYTSLSEIRDVVDSAVICVPAKFVSGVIEEMGRKAIPFAVTVTAGFREIGDIALEEELVETARKNNVRILGPNIFGLIYTPAKLISQFGFENVVPGNVSIITQSGALGGALMGRTFMEGIGISAVVSVGNKADIRDQELLEFLCEDPHTKIILLYMEGLRHGREFMEIVKTVSMKKPVIVLKSGRTKAGAKAVASHTASLAGEDKVFSGAFAQCGALRAPSLRDALDWTKVLLHLPLPKGDDVLILTNGGGFGVLAVDKTAEVGMKLYDNPDWIFENLMPILPSIATVSNPLDVTAQTQPETFIECIRLAMNEPSISSLIAIYGLTTGMDTKKFTKDMVETVGRPGKPMVLCMIGGAPAMDQINDFNLAKLPAFYYPEEAVSSFEVLYKYRRMRQNIETSHTQQFEWDLEGIDRILTTSRKDVSGFIDLEDSMKVLSKGPLKMAPYRMVGSVLECMEFVQENGYPVVMKASAGNIIHKTEKGAVIVDINSDQELEVGFRQLREISERVMIMKQVKGREIIIGATMDPVFGPTVMYGLGGVMVEALKDVSFRIAPVTWADTEEMISEVKGSVILGDFRGKKAVDIASVKEAIMALGDLMVRCPRIREIEVNPFFATSEGAIAVDCRVRTD